MRLIRHPENRLYAMSCLSGTRAAKGERVFILDSDGQHSPSDIWKFDAKLDEVLVFRTVNGERLGGRFDLTEIRSGRMPDPLIFPGDVVVVGFSSLRGIYRDILQVTPLIGTFASVGIRAADGS